MKSQMKLRSDLGWKQMKWSIAKELQPKDVEIVQARVLAIQPDVSSLFLVYVSCYKAIC